MGPGNRVMDTKSSYYGDEKYRQHDLGYSDMTNPYFNYNESDEKLLRSPTEGLVDVVGKGVFAAKKALDVFNVPSLYQGGFAAKKKDVNAKSYYDADLVPWHETSRWKPAFIGSIPYGSSYGRKKDFGWYDRSGRFSNSETAQYVDVDEASAPAVGARGSSGRKHDYIVKYDYS